MTGEGKKRCLGFDERKRGGIVAYVTKGRLFFRGV